MTRLWRVDYNRGDYVFFTYTQNSKKPTQKRIKEIFILEWGFLPWEQWGETYKNADLEIRDWDIMKPGMYLIPTNTE